jgi:hypothetical protein
MFNHNEYIDLASTDGTVVVTIGTRRSLAVDPVRQEVTRSQTDECLEISVNGAGAFRIPAVGIEDLAAALTEALTGWRTLRARDRSPAEVSA